MISNRPSPTLELADVIRRHAHLLNKPTTDQIRVLRRLAACRTAALGGHVETCDHCQHQRIAYNSCRNRHCPKCQACACARWMEDRASELLPVEYFHVVFTVPPAFNALALSNRCTVYGILFKAVAQTLLEVAANPRNLGARIGFLAILHTWGQNLSLHPHLHCVIPGGGLSADGSRWIACRPGFFLPVRVLSRVFRGKFIDLLRRAWAKGRLRRLPDHFSFEALADAAVRDDWVVYAKPPFGGPAQVLKYLSRYTHKIAISNRRLVSMDDHSVSFRWKDYAHGNHSRVMTLEAGEFLRRFLMHVVPRGFMRIRHFGFLADRFRAGNLQQCRKLLCDTTGRSDAPDATVVSSPGDSVADHPAHDQCPVCHRGKMIVGQRIESLSTWQLFHAWWDTS